MDIVEVKTERVKHVKEARELLDKASAEKRDLTAEERSHYEAHMAECDKLATLVKNEEERDRLSKINFEIPAIEPKRDEDKRGAFRNYLVNGGGALTAKEQRALQMDNPTAGGYIVAPQTFSTELIKGMDDATFANAICRVIMSPKSESYGVPVLDANPADSNWTSEILIGTEDSTMAFGKRELRPHPLAKPIKISKKLLRASAIDVEAEVRNRLAYKMGVSIEKSFLTGNGVNQMLGCLTASNDGISTSRDVSTGNTATEIRFDGLIEAKMTLKSGYRNRAKWLFHRDAVKMIRKLKDGEGKYIWEPSVRAGDPDSILNMPVYESEYVSNTFTTGLYVGILGDFNYYWIVYALDMEIQRIEELYAATNQTAFFARTEADGMPVLEEAFARVKLG